VLVLRPLFDGIAASRSSTDVTEHTFKECGAGVLVSFVMGLEGSEQKR
jgi:hypothetical protein